MKSTFLAIALLASAAVSAEARCRPQQVVGANAPLPAANINRALLDAAATDNQTMRVAKTAYRP
ncbi:hypothetical protein [Aliiroseovarius crassostreae]|uniref:hypothetical protein n=1 Tax=Aliiroseovarius crassostreae TaxID=154981 RepID=UPI001C314858|nr:hypothetical protein [Aliiroseovarius crassostreae]